MSAAEANDWDDVLDRVKHWSPTDRIALARRILEGLVTTDGGGPRRGPRK